YRLRSISYDCSRQLDGSRSSVRRSRPVSGTTTADLARDGMLTVTTNHRFGSARLTEARELICADAGLSEPLRTQKASVLEVARPCRRGDRIAGLLLRRR